MKRSWIGFYLLAALLILGLGAARVMGSVHQEAADQMDRAAVLALEENWAEAAALTVRVRHTWEKLELLRSALSDHTPMEQIDGMLAALEVYLAERDRVAFAALCRELACQLNAMGEAHRLALNTLL